MSNRLTMGGDLSTRALSDYEKGISLVESFESAAAPEVSRKAQRAITSPLYEPAVSHLINDRPETRWAMIPPPPEGIAVFAFPSPLPPSLTQGLDIYMQQVRLRVESLGQAMDSSTSPSEKKALSIARGAGMSLLRLEETLRSIERDQNYSFNQINRFLQG